MSPAHDYLDLGALLVQALVCGQNGHILSSSLGKRLNKKVRLGAVIGYINATNCLVKYSREKEKRWRKRRKQKEQKKNGKNRKKGKSRKNRKKVEKSTKSRIFLT